MTQCRRSKNADRIGRFGRLCLPLLTTWVFVACTPGTRPLSEVSADPTDCQVIQHEVGEACVPHTIQRLVTLDGVTYEYALAMDLKPIATVKSGQVLPFEPGAEVVNVGSVGEPNLEKILALEPDLIVGLDFNAPIYAELSQIAPTVLIPFEHSGEWKERFIAFGDLLGKGDRAQAVMDAYDQRILSLQEALGTAPPVVSVVRVYPDTINLYLKDSFCGVILEDAGLARPPAQDLSAAEAIRQFGNPIQYTISQELFQAADGDVLFIWTADNEPETNRISQQKLEQLKTDPLWRSLNVVQKDAVYPVPGYWIGSGPLAANAVIDDLFKYLVTGGES
jgi:iron complex transport system substrate-binding protein